MNQSSTLLGRLARGSLAAGRIDQPEGLPASSLEQSAEPFADIRATNSPAAPSRTLEKAGKQPRKTKESGKGVRSKAKEDVAQTSAEVNDDIDEVGWRDDDLASMEDVVIEKSNVLMM